MRSVDDFTPEMPFELLLRDGLVEAVVDSVRPSRSREDT